MALGRDVRAAGGHTWFGSPAGVLGHLRIWGTGLTAATPRPHAVGVAFVALQSWLLRVSALELPGEGQGHGQQPNPCWSRASRAFQHSARCGVFSFCPGSARPPANEWVAAAAFPRSRPGPRPAPPPPASRHPRMRGRSPRRRHAARASRDVACAGVTPPAPLVAQPPLTHVAPEARTRGGAAACLASDVLLTAAVLTPSPLRAGCRTHPSFAQGLACQVGVPGRTTAA